MAFRYLIYSTGTTFSNTIVRESATDNPGVFEASYYTDFVIPAIQPLYLWQVTGGTTVVPNNDTNVYNYLQDIAPPPAPEDDASVGYVTGLTNTKIDKVTGVTDNLGVFDASGNLVDAGYTIPQLTGLTTYTFVESGGTTITQVGNTVTIYSATPTGTTVAWGDITGTISNQTDLWNILTNITGETANKLDIAIFTGYTASTQPVIDSALTGVTNLGTGTTIGGISGRNVTFKSISVLGGLSLSGDADNLIISGQTGGTGSSVWGGITGTLSDQTDLWNTLTGMTATTATKLDTSVFNSYTGTTETRLETIESDIIYLSGQTDLKLNISDFNTYTGATQPVIDAVLTGATNGLTATGGDVELGGALTKDTSITGIAYGLTANTRNILLQATNGIDIIDTDGVGGINIESDAGTIALVGNTNLSVERTKLEISETQILITDSRTGTTAVGMQYAADYSANFTPESLITKRYADAIAAGLTVKASVLVATTSGITLSGEQTVDGVAVVTGDRVLVKNQASGATNGIYVVSTGTWTRATDFDGNPSGEVVSGDLIPVISGDTNYNTLWALITQNPITVGVTDLVFTLFSSPHEMIPGVGISIVGNTISVNGSALAGNSISWTGNTFNVDINSGTLASALAAKLNVSDFNTFTGTTLPANYVSTTTFNTFTGTTLPATYLSITAFNAYTGTTETRLETIESDIVYLSGQTDQRLLISDFNAYTGSTAPNEIFLIHTGGTSLNNVLATPIEWDAAEVTGSSFSWTGTTIEILETGDYELSYNLPYVSASNKNIAIGANIILNNNVVLDVTASGSWVAVVGAAGSNSIPPVLLSLSVGNKLTLAAFRTGADGTATSKLTGSILIKKRNTLQ